jgi:hypothetical protein
MDQASALRSEGSSVTNIQRRKKMGKQIDELKAQGFDAFCIAEPGSPGELRSLRDA